MKRRFQFTLTALLIVVTLAAGACGAASYAYRQHVLANQRKSVIVRLRNALTTLHLYNDNFNRLPPATLQSPSGEPMSSWRFIMLPYIEQQDMEHPENGPFYNQRWDSPGNARFARYAPIFSFYSAGTDSARAQDTSVFAVTGSGTGFDESTQTSLKELTEDPATRHTILLVEVRSSRTHWMQPGDFDIRTMPRIINEPAGTGISGTCAGGFCVGFANGDAWMLRNDTPFDTLALFFTIESARKHDRDKMLGPYRIAVEL